MWSDVMCDLTWGGEYCSWWYLWNDDSNTVLLTRNASSHRTSSYHNIVFLHWSKNIQSSKMIACKNFVQFRIIMSSVIAGHLFENKRMYIWIWIVVRNLTFDKSLTTPIFFLYLFWNETQYHQFCCQWYCTPFLWLHLFILLHKPFVQMLFIETFPRTWLYVCTLNFILIH